jgi:hypothetical protein
MKKVRKEWSREEIEAVYNRPGVIGREAAKELGIPVREFSALLKKHSIGFKKKESANLQLKDKEWLRDQYLNKQKSVKQISVEIGATIGNVRSALVWMGIKTRGVKESLATKYPHGRFGKESGRWAGGRRKTGRGYVQIYSPNHKEADINGYVMEHRLVMEQALNRPLLKNEDVHHQNKDRGDNRLENLIVCSRSQHKKIHSLMKQNAELVNKLKQYEENINRSED